MEAVNSYVAIYLCGIMIVLGAMCLFGRLNQKNKSGGK